LAEINVTPLIDLAFTLLIIFMLTTPLIENSMELIVPSSSTATTPVDTSQVRIIEITAAGALRYEGQPINATALEETLVTAKAANPNLAIVIRADRTSTVQRFADIMDIVKRADISRIGFATRAEE